MGAHLKKTDRKNANIFWVFLVLSLGVGAFFLGTSLNLPEAVVSGILAGGNPGSNLTVLVMGKGIDGVGDGDGGLTDTLMVANIDPHTHQISLFSIPRDSRVQIPGHGLGKINSCNAYGGPELALACVNNLLGTNIQYYVAVNYFGFVDMINTMGGVYINVPVRMFHQGDNALTTINLYPGYQHLNGQQALGFVSWRDGALGDIGRTERQQEFLKAVAKQFLQFGTIFQLPRLTEQMQKAVQTNLPTSQMLSAVEAVQGMGKAKLVSATAPGYFANIYGPDAAIYGSSYWLVIPADVRAAYHDLLNGKRDNLFDPQAASLAAAIGGQTTQEPATGQATGQPMGQVVTDTANPQAGSTAIGGSSQPLDSGGSGGGSSGADAGPAGSGSGGPTPTLTQ